MRARSRSLALLPLTVAACILAGTSTVSAVDSGPGDVLTYRGDAARTGGMPGPGPSGVPVVRWTYEPGAPIGSQVAVADGSVFLVSVVGTVHALDLGTGAERWTISTGAPSRGSPSIVGGLVIVANSNGVQARWVDEGRAAWVNPETGPVAGTPAVVGDIVLAASDDGRVTAIDVMTGTTVWQSSIGVPTVASVAADLDIGTVVIGGRDGVAVGLDIIDGHERWRHDTGDRARIGTPTIAGGQVYIATLDGAGAGTRHVHVLDAASGEPRWLLASPGDAPAFAPAVAHDRAVISGEDGSVTAVDRTTGALQWRYQAPGVVEVVPAVADDVVYVASNGSLALALDAATGTELWRVPIEGIPHAAAVTGGLVLVGTTSGTLYAIGGGES